jgi:glycine/D-amino acid oxidase-like deaminating enzyme
MQPPQSLWWSTLDEPVTPRAALDRHLDVDVAIVGGGFTGLWTARELLRRDPTLQVAVLEKSVCGFGASGRNGGWVSAIFPVSDEGVVKQYGIDVFTEQRLVMQDAVVELGTSLSNDGIDAQFAQGGTMTFARSEVQSARLQALVDHERELGVGPDDLAWLDGDTLHDHGCVDGALGAKYSPHCARVHPARLVRGLSDTVERLGALVFEQSAVTRIIAGRRGRRPEVVTVGGTVHADYVVRATEAFTSTLPGERRTLAPMYSLMVATESLPQAFWDEVGFRRYETFADDRHLVIYGQRTSDDRIAFGGRGSPYHFGSTVEERFDVNDKVFSMLEATLRELFPAMDGTITHQWGGPLGLSRDHWPSVAVNFETGMASAGGYTGDGVTLSHVAATALADLLVAPDADTRFTRLPFVQRHSRRWEVEPLRWLGINVGLGLANRADNVEATRHRESRAGALLERLMG